MSYITTSNQKKFEYSRKVHFSKVFLAKISVNNEKNQSGRTCKQNCFGYWNSRELLQYFLNLASLYSQFSEAKTNLWYRLEDCLGNHLIASFSDKVVKTCIYPSTSLLTAAYNMSLLTRKPFFGISETVCCLGRGKISFRKRIKRFSI